SYETVVKRWPVILTGIIDTIYQIDHEIGVSLPTLPAGGEEATRAEEKVVEGKAIIEKISKLKYDMARDRALEPIPVDGEPYVEEYNKDLDRLAEENKNTWFTAPWLFADSRWHRYRLLRAYLTQTIQWREFDPFFSQKQDTFRGSATAIYQLATTMHELEAEKESLQSDPTKLAVLFKEMIQMCLWYDLSLLTHLSHDDIATLQTVGKDAQAARKEFILKDDQEQVIQYLETLSGKDARVDFVLDNAGFELFTDFIFADFLVTYTPYVSRVVFHPKLIPWFVSDVTPSDFKSTIPSLQSETFFGKPLEGSGAATLPFAEGHLHLQEMVSRWKSYLDSGVFALSVSQETKLGASNDKLTRLAQADFWTGPWPYWDMKTRAPEVWSDLRESSLVIFKVRGYRKLTGDVRWPVATPFDAALGPLAGDFPVLSLRTNKADVVVGVPQAVADRLDASGEKWRVNGKYALVSFLPRSP
ncbi:hypothetical protein PHLGIDRAFT_514562, partial [Phlebiopsis gigantea 11061_1 CR5-6]